MDYTYDAFGNRKTTVTGAGTTTYAYDAADRLTSVDPPGAGSTSYTWDDNGNLTDRGSDAFDWDAEDRLPSSTLKPQRSSAARMSSGITPSPRSSQSTPRIIGTSTSTPREMKPFFAASTEQTVAPMLVDTRCADLPLRVKRKKLRDDQAGHPSTCRFFYSSAATLS